MSLVRFARRFVPRRVLPAREAYALWADTYPARPHNPLMEAEQAVTVPILRAIRAQRALDVGTGTGRCALLLREAGANFVVGIDMSMAMLGHFASPAPRVCADACHLPFGPALFDLVCSSLMVGDIEHLGVWIAEMARALAPGGHLVYSDFHPSWSEERPRRTFRTADGRLCELPYFPHTMDEHLFLLAEAGLAVCAVREPRAAGQESPCLVVFHAVKAPRDARRFPG